MTIDAGSRLSRYQIRSKIGEGGMGEVYLAQDTKLDRKVAVKILPPEFAGDQDRLRRFAQEARAAAALNHPNIAHIYEVDESDGVSFIAMEFIDGFTLRQLIRERQTELPKFLRYLQHAAEGLAKAHAAGIVHRDLKPANIMVTRDGHAKILDFGLAKLIEQPPLPSGDSSEIATVPMAQRSTSGVIMGTVGYMSPEQAQGKTKGVDHRSDIFSFGCILFEAVTGQRAFKGEDSIDSLNKIIREPIRPLSDFLPDAPDHLQRIVRRCLAKDPDERYQTIKDVAIELRELRRELETSGINTTVPPPPGVRGYSSEASGLRVPAPERSTAGTQVMSAGNLFGKSKHLKLAALLVLVLVVAGGAIGGIYWRSRPVASTAIHSIAVMPFVNESGNADFDYLSDGMTETLISSLSQLPSLNVKARSSVFRYKGKPVDAKTVGKELNVEAILNGRVLERGDQLTLSLELVNAQTENIIWTDQYVRKQADLVNLQTEIARDVSSKLKTKISGTDEQKLAKTFTTNPEAYRFYLQGRFYWNKRTAESLMKAIEQFKASTDRDPNYALGYAGLADCYVLQEQYLGYPSSETLRQARAFAEKALQLDQQVGEAHASLGLINNLSWNWAEAEKEFRTAIDLNSNYPTVHHWYSIYLQDMGQQDQALTEIKRALELDPLSIPIGINLGCKYLSMGEPETAIDHFRTAIELDPNFWHGHLWLGITYLVQRRNDDALSELQKSVALSNKANQALSFLGYAYATTSKRAEALAILNELKDRYAKREAIGFDIAPIFAGLGDKNQAFAWLEKDFQVHSGRLVSIRWQPQFAAIRDDARYADLLQRMGLKL